MSDLEALLLEQIAAAGLPMPKTEFRFESLFSLTPKLKKPRRWRFDCCWDRLKLLVEVDGATWANGRHNRGAGYESDAEKTNEAGERGWLVLRFTGAMVKDGRAIAQIRRILELRQRVRWGSLPVAGYSETE